mmetsp:Transcript_8640/g.17506  ORF Transcript_8640/g.17506 Transcript_8640/m.17506 type:complete len:540 (+) Transcript_8640:183-1802(+)
MEQGEKERIAQAVAGVQSELDPPSLPSHASNTVDDLGEGNPKPLRDPSSPTAPDENDDLYAELDDGHSSLRRTHHHSHEAGDRDSAKSGLLAVDSALKHSSGTGLGLDGAPNNNGNHDAHKDHQQSENVSGSLPPSGQDEEESEGEESDDDSDVDVVLSADAGDGLVRLPGPATWNRPGIPARAQVTARQNGIPTASSALANMMSVLPSPTGAFPSVHQKSLYDLEIGKLAEKPWRERGADVSDYFNYGFDEATWKMYCERQQQMRLESAGLAKIKMHDQVGQNVHPPAENPSNVHYGPSGGGMGAVGVVPPGFPMMAVPPLPGSFPGGPPNAVSRSVHDSDDVMTLTGGGAVSGMIGTDNMPEKSGPQGLPPGAGMLPPLTQQLAAQLLRGISPGHGGPAPPFPFPPGVLPPGMGAFMPMMPMNPRGPLPGDVLPGESREVGSAGDSGPRGSKEGLMDNNGGRDRMGRRDRDWGPVDRDRRNGSPPGHDNTFDRGRGGRYGESDRDRMREPDDRPHSRRDDRDRDRRRDSRSSKRSRR